MSLHRREILQRALVLTGMAIIPADAIAARAKAGRLPGLDKPNRALVIAISDTIIPVTDTPGAVAVGVPKLFEAMLTEWASPQQHSLLLAAIKRIDDAAKTAEGNGFTALSPEKRYAVLSKIDGQSGMSDPGYGLLKELVTTLYYLSEVGSTVELRYEQAPGSWDPSLPVTSETRTQGGAALL